ncbi:uncharacterized protein F5Z01DRAFT_350647 [Emericellopsis atlantica]|uniref:Uncharacterized protein n=1 Tax=Emericellopsis atlantica TaxID=2614577 RepID=A0A9P8CL52_9HYPO|nr:uncharacterized protein F5Z01DRAFT_350647 [Emericellopsis atlantica]KAG9250635.1 hypothetical protein F5Z01DRAFT_350647 [Emericellopsis atlantica]
MSGLDKNDFERALKDIFQGESAKDKSLSQVRKCIKRHAQNPAISALVQSSSMEAVSKLAHGLLSSGAFETTPLPEIQSGKLSGSKPPAVNGCNGIETLLRPQTMVSPVPSSPPIVQTSSSINSTQGSGSKLSAEGKEREPLKAAQLAPPSDQDLDLSTALLEVDYSTQHRVLTCTQFLLEQACFDFAKRTFPSILEENGWDCAEALELNLMAKALSARPRGPSSSLKLKSKPIQGCIDIISEIRHAAVHRHRLSAKTLDQHLHTAVDLLEAFDDRGRLEQIKKLSDKIRFLLLQLDLDSNTIRSALSKEEVQIENQIRLLDQRKEALRFRAKTSLQRTQTAASLDLEEALYSAIPRTTAGATLKEGRCLLGAMITVIVFTAFLLWRMRDC